MTCGLATPRATDGVAIIATLSGIPALRAASTTLSIPAFIASGT